jgi:hypothetical protein
MTVPEPPSEHDDDEDAPLLPDIRPPHISSPSSSSSLPFYQTRSRLIITLIIFAIIFILAFGGYLIGVPSIRLYEDIVCHHYYNRLEGKEHRGLEEGIEERLCKADLVQEELNFLLAGLHFLGAVPRKWTKEGDEMKGNERTNEWYSSAFDSCSLWAFGR